MKTWRVAARTPLGCQLYVIAHDSQMAEIIVEGINRILMAPRPQLQKHQEVTHAHP